jgi:hypothetical protein
VVKGFITRHQKESLRHKYCNFFQGLIAKTQ